MRSQLDFQARVIPMNEPDPTGSLPPIALFYADGSPFTPGSGPAGADSTVPGPTGPTGPAGPAGVSPSGAMIYKGAWVNAAYAKDSVVRHTGNLYIAPANILLNTEPGVSLSPVINKEPQYANSMKTMSRYIGEYVGSGTAGSVSGYLYKYFDLATGGTITLNAGSGGAGLWGSTPSSPQPYIGEKSPTATAPFVSTGRPAGQYYIGAGPNPASISLSAGATFVALDRVEWELVM